MKQTILTLIIAASFAALTAATVDNDTKNAIATANKEQGLLIFTDCKPNAEYEVITTLTAKSVSLDLKSFEASALSYNELKADIFKQIHSKKNKGKFDGTQALIIYPDEQKADLVKFK